MRSGLGEDLRNQVGFRGERFQWDFNWCLGGQFSPRGQIPRPKRQGKWRGSVHPGMRVGAWPRPMGALFTGETDKVGPDRSEGGRVGCSLRPAVSLLEGNRLSVAFPP